MNTPSNLKPNSFLFTLGLLGVLSTLPIVPRLLSLQSSPPPMAVEMIQIISVAQSSLLLMLMVWLGSVYSKKVGLSAPLVFALFGSESISEKISSKVAPALIGGFLGGIVTSLFLATLSSHLPAEFLSNAEGLVLPWYTRILYGGITEELLVRWGLMSFFVWGTYRLTQKTGSGIRDYNYIIAIAASALIFGLGHLPIGFALSSEITLYLLAYIILGNASFGLIAGYLYWKYG